MLSLLPLISLAFLTTSLCSPLASSAIGNVTYGDAYQQAVYIYTEGQYGGPLGVRKNTLILDNQSQAFTFREVSSTFMGWPPKAPGIEGHVHFGHLEFGGQCLGVVQGNLAKTAVIREPCSIREDSSQILQYWMWDETFNDLTFLGYRKGRPLNFSYTIADPALPDDVIYLLNHQGESNSLLSFGKHGYLKGSK